MPVNTVASKAAAAKAAAARKAAADAAAKKAAPAKAAAAKKAATAAAAQKTARAAQVKKDAAARYASRQATAKAIPHAAMGPLPPGVNPAVARAAQQNAERSRLADIQSISTGAHPDLASDYSSTMGIAPKLTAVGKTLAPPPSAPLVTGPVAPAPAPAVVPRFNTVNPAGGGPGLLPRAPGGGSSGGDTGSAVHMPSRESPNGGGNPYNRRIFELSGSPKASSFAMPTKAATGFGSVNNPFGFGSGNTGMNWGSGSGWVGSRGGNK